MPPSDAVLSAKARAESLMLSQQALQRWAAIQEAILGGAASAAAELAAGEDAAIPTKAIRQHGAQCIRMIESIEAKLAAVTAALGASFGFTSAEVSDSTAYLRETCEAMRDTPQDGSELAALLTTIASRHSAPNLLG